MLENLDYKVPKTEDCVLIDLNLWFNSSRLIQSQKITGKVSPTYITKIIKTNTALSELAEGTLIAMSKVASDVAPYSSFQIDGTKSYYNLPVSQVLGYFKGPEQSLLFLNMIRDKILIRKISPKIELLEVNSNMVIGEVIKKGPEVHHVNLGDHVLIRDNISTELSLKEGDFLALEERMVVGIFGNDFTLNKMKFINESILMQPYISSKVLNSKVLITPEITYEDLDYSDMYNRDLFKVDFIDESIEGITKGDVILLNRDYTNYVYYEQTKYFIINGKKYVNARVKENI